MLCHFLRHALCWALLPDKHDKDLNRFDSTRSSRAPWSPFPLPWQTTAPKQMKAQHAVLKCEKSGPPPLPSSCESMV